MTTPDKMLVVREVEWLSDGMVPVSIKVLTCAAKKEPYESLEPHAGARCANTGNRFCVWHSAAGAAGTCCGGVMDFADLEDAMSMVETRFPGARWLIASSRSLPEADCLDMPCRRGQVSPDRRVAGRRLV